MSMIHNRVRYPKEREEKTRDEIVRKQARDMEDAPPRPAKVEDAA
jgi:hypothetical protein